jgi:hypothetical protein
MSQHQSKALVGRILGPAAAMVITLAGCEDRKNTSPAPAAGNPAPASGSGSAPSAANPAPPSGPRADNTARNERDRNSANQTPPDQGDSEADRKVTAEIRKAVVADGALSTNAQNCKIITRNGVVTLRGPVANQAEKAAVETKARAVAGVSSVVNELEIAGSR